MIQPVQPVQPIPIGGAHHPANNVAFTSSARYPDPLVEVLDERFRAVRLFSASVEQLATGCRWAEGPVWFGDLRCLLWSDIPNDRILRWDECSGAVSVFRQPSGHANGLTRRPHRARRPHHAAGRPLRWPAPELAERHRLPRRGRQHLVHRPELRHHRLVGRRPRGAGAPACGLPARRRDRPARLRHR
jgi:hypothetical protein